MLSRIAEFVTLARVLCVVFGLLLGELIRFLINRHRIKTGLTPKASTFNSVVGVIIIIAMVWIMVATQQARNCAITLNTSVANEQRAFQTAITKSLAIPSELRVLPQNDPRVRAYMDPIQQEYLAQREANVVNQEAASKACGKK